MESRSSTGRHASHSDDERQPLRELYVGYGDADGEGNGHRFGVGNGNGNVKGNGHR